MFSEGIFDVVQILVFEGIDVWVLSCGEEGVSREVGREEFGEGPGHKGPRREYEDVADL